MSHKYYYLLAIPVIAFFTVVGLGFWQSRKTAPIDQSTIQAWGAAAAAEKEQPYLPPDKETDPNSPEVKIKQLEDAIRHYGSVKSFRGSITQNTSEGTISGNIEYVSPLRLHALLTAGENQGIEIIMVGETAYARMLKDEWKMTNDKNIKDFGRNFFATMTDKTATLESFGIENKERISWSWNEVKKCTAYETNYIQEEQFMNIEICVNEAGRIAYIKKQTTEGETTTEYNDFNSFFIIERPMLPLLEPYLEITGSAEEEPVPDKPLESVFPE